MIKLRDNEEHIKYVKKHVYFTKSRRKFGKVGGNKNVREIGEKCTETKILADENRNISLEKNWENFSRSLKIFLKIGGNLKQGEMYHCLRGMDASGHKFKV